MRPGAAASISWAASCGEGPVRVRVEYEIVDESSAVSVHTACSGGLGIFSGYRSCRA